MVIQLLQRPFEATIQDLYRAVRPGGSLYLSLPEKTFVNYLLYTILSILNNPVCRPVVSLCARRVARLRYKLAGLSESDENLKGKIMCNMMHIL